VETTVAVEVDAKVKGKAAAVVRAAENQIAVGLALAVIPSLTVVLTQLLVPVSGLFL
jgi:hypothetical protein